MSLPTQHTEHLVVQYVFPKYFIQVQLNERQLLHGWNRLLQKMTLEYENRQPHTFECTIDANICKINPNIVKYYTDENDHLKIIDVIKFDS